MIFSQMIIFLSIILCFSSMVETGQNDPKAVFEAFIKAETSSTAGVKPGQNLVELDMDKVRELQKWIGQIADKVVEEEYSLFLGFYKCQKNFDLKTILENSLEKIKDWNLDGDQKKHQQFAQNLFSFGAILSAEIGGPIREMNEEVNEEENSNYLRSLIKAFECVGGKFTPLESNTNVEWYDSQNSLFKFEIVARFAKIETSKIESYVVEKVWLKFINEQNNNNNIDKFMLLQALSTEMSPFDVKKLVTNDIDSFCYDQALWLRRDLTINMLNSDPITYRRVWRQMILHLSNEMKSLYDVRIQCIMINFVCNLIQRMEKNSLVKRFLAEFYPSYYTLTSIGYWKEKFVKNSKYNEKDRINAYAHYADAIRIDWNIWRAAINQINEAISQLNRPNDEKKCLSTGVFENVVKMLFKNNLSGDIMQSVKSWKKAKHEEYEKEQRRSGFFHKKMPEKNHFEEFIKNWYGKVPSSATEEQVNSMKCGFLRGLEQLETEEIIKLLKNIQAMCQLKIQQYQLETPFKINILKNQEKNDGKFYGFLAEIMPNFGAKFVKDENANEQIEIDFDNANKMMEKLEKIAVEIIIKKDEKQQQFKCRKGIKTEKNFENVIKEIIGEEKLDVIKPKLDDLMEFKEFVKTPREIAHISRSEIEKAVPQKYANEWHLFNLLFSFGTRIVAYVHGKSVNGTNANGEIDEESDAIGHKRIQAFFTVIKCFELPEWANIFSIFDSLIKFEVISSKEAEQNDQTVPNVFGISIKKHKINYYFWYRGEPTDHKRISKQNFIMLKGLHEQRLSIYEAIEMFKLFHHKAERPRATFNTSKIIKDLVDKIWKNEFSTSNREIMFWQFFQHITSNFMSMVTKNAIKIEAYMSVDENKLQTDVLKNVKNKMDIHFEEMRTKWDDIISEEAKIEQMSNIRYDLAINFEFNPSKEIRDRVKSMDYDKKFNNVKEIDEFLNSEQLPIIKNLVQIESVKYKFDTENSLDKLRELNETINVQESELEKEEKERKKIEYNRLTNEKEKENLRKVIKQKIGQIEAEKVQKQKLEKQLKNEKVKMEKEEKSKMGANIKAFIEVIEQIKRKSNETITSDDKKALQNLCTFTKLYAKHNDTIKIIKTNLKQKISEQKKPNNGRKGIMEKIFSMKTKTNEEQMLEKVEKLQAKHKDIVEKILEIKENYGTDLLDIANEFCTEEEIGKEKVDEENKATIGTKSSSSSSSKQKQNKETEEEKLLNEIDPIEKNKIMDKLDIFKDQKELTKVIENLKSLDKELAEPNERESQINIELEGIEREKEKMEKENTKLLNEIDQIVKNGIMDKLDICKDQKELMIVIKNLKSLDEQLAQLNERECQINIELEGIEVEKEKVEKKNAREQAKKEAHIIIDIELEGIEGEKEKVDIEIEKWKNQIDQIEKNGFMQELEEEIEAYKREVETKKNEEKLAKTMENLKNMMDQLEELCVKTVAKLCKQESQINQQLERVANQIAKLDNEIKTNIEKAKKLAEIIWEELKKMKEHFAKELEADNSNVGEGDKEIA